MLDNSTDSPDIYVEYSIDRNYIAGTGGIIAIVSCTHKGDAGGKLGICDYDYIGAASDKK